MLSKTCIYPVSVRSAPASATTGVKWYTNRVTLDGALTTPQS